jgi:hypothetical protein
MRNLARVGLTAGVLCLGLALGGCENFDPTAIFDAEIFNTKKPLPGDRRPVFPEGTPGVPQGVPPELVRGYQAPAEPEAAPKQATTEPTEPKPKPKAKPKPKVVAKPADQSAPARETSRPTQPPQAQQAPAASAWPGSARPSGGTAWPDPPAAR